MLEFIVLGQIPGTNLYVSFTAFSISIIMANLLAVSGLKYIKHHNMLPTEDIETATNKDQAKES